MFLWILDLGAWIFSPSPCPAATAHLTPSADTTLLENFPTNNMGGQTWLNAGTTQNYTKNRGLLKFDIAGRIPAGARITAISLTLHVTRSPVDGDLPSTFDLHRMLVDWGEGNKSGTPPLLGADATQGEANWTHRFALTTNAWAAPGGAAGVDFAAHSSADTYVYGVNFSPYVFELAPAMTADVQSWLDHPHQNFGWMLKARSEADNFSARRFGSREDEFQAPELMVEYSVLQFDRITKAHDRIVMEFTAEAGIAYAVESCDVLNASGWQTLANIPSATESRIIQVDDPIAGAGRFYRLKVVE